MDANKKAVSDFWSKDACGEKLYLKGLTQEDFLKQSEARYKIEPFIIDFAEFGRYKNKKVLEVGVGLGADHLKFANVGAILTGIDLTEHAVKLTQQRFHIFGLDANLVTADAENLSFRNESFDLVYSWGVLHHSPDILKTINEIYRVLKRGGEIKIMIYHKYSFVGYMLWIRYAFLKLKPLTSLKYIYNHYLESPGTQTFTIKEAKKLFDGFTDVRIKTILSHGDLLASSAGQRHRGLLLSLARLIWPRWIIKTFFHTHGLFMVVSGKK